MKNKLKKFSIPDTKGPTRDKKEYFETIQFQKFKLL